MSPDYMNPAEVEHRLWDDIERRQTGMLMLVGGPPQHAQPMTGFLERGERRLWFFADAWSELVSSITVGQEAMFVWQQPDLRACIGGRLEIHHDRDRLERYWNAAVAAWHPRGRDDPNLTMLCMSCEEAVVWVSTAGPVRTVWEMAKATATRREPQVGVTAHLTFH